MKKVISLTLALILVLLCTGCSFEKPEDIEYFQSMQIAPMMYNSEELVEESDMIFEGVVVNISTKVINRKTWQFQILPIGTNDPGNYDVVTVYTVFVLLSYKGLTGVLVDFISEHGNWYELGPTRKQVLERMGIDPKVGLVHYSLGSKLQVGNSYMFCLEKKDGGKMMSTYYNLGLEGDNKNATEIRARLWPFALLMVGLNTAVIAAATATTILIIRKKKKKTGEARETAIPENE